MGTDVGGAAGVGSTSVTGSGQGGSAGTSVSAGAGGTSVGASGVATGAGGSTGGIGGATGGSAPVDAGTAGSAGTAGTGGAGGAMVVDAGSDVRDAVAEPRIDAPIDAPPETGCMNATQCALKAGLVHRYSFSGTGNMATDSVGTANGTISGTTLNGSGSLVLAAGSNQYVDLPNGIIKALSNATFEFGNVGGGAQSQRLFDFGNTTGNEGTQGTASTSFYFTPLGGTPTMMFAAFKRSDVTGPNETRAIGAGALPTNTMLQLTVVVDNTNNRITVYRNGTADGTVAFNDTLSLLTT